MRLATRPGSSFGIERILIAVGAAVFLLFVTTTSTIKGLLHGTLFGDSPNAESRSYVEVFVLTNRSKLVVSPPAQAQAEISPVGSASPQPSQAEIPPIGSASPQPRHWPSWVIPDYADKLAFWHHKLELERQYYLDRSGRKFAAVGRPWDPINHPRMGDYPIPNHPLRSALDPLGWRVSGAGVGAVLRHSTHANGTEPVLAGHPLLTATIPQRVPDLDELVACTAGTTCNFTVTAYDATGNRIVHMGASFQARLYGSIILAHDSIVDNRDGSYTVYFTPHDLGAFVVEVWLGIVEGEDADAKLAFTYSPPYVVDQVIYRSKHLLHVIAPTGPDDFDAQVPIHMLQRTPLCKGAHTRHGRWVFLGDGDHTPCVQPYCTGTTLQRAGVSDPFNFSRGYVWAPYRCHYRLYAQKDLLDCARGCNYQSWSFSGDSVGREMLQNMQSLFTDFKPVINIPKLQTDDWSGDFQIENVSVTMSWRNPVEGCVSDVSIVHLHEPHYMAERKTGDIQDAATDSLLLQTVNAFQGGGVGDISAQPEDSAFKPCFFYVAPNVHREIDHVERRMTNDFHIYCTHRRTAALAARRRKAMSDAGLQHHILEGFDVTEAHWWASHDGLHYSDRTINYGLTDYLWHGGASHMITQMFLNGVCNKPCNPRRASWAQEDSA